jgi:hypothetical protein
MRSPTEEQAIEPASDRFTEVRFSDSCKAPAEAVYDLLADLRTHLQWGGRDQTRVFRLLSLDAVPEPATPGTVFTSTGAIPGSFDGGRTARRSPRRCGRRCSSSSPRPLLPVARR